MSLGASNAGALDRGLQILVAAVLLMFTNGRLDSWSDASRLATIESLVHRGTFTIDGSPYQHTGDRVAVPGRGFLGHHPPALALVLAGPAWLLEKAGVEFEPDGGALVLGAAHAPARRRHARGGPHPRRRDPRLGLQQHLRRSHPAR